MTVRPPWTPPELAPEEISGKRFRVTWRGYSRDEVTRFLAQVASGYEAALAQASEAAVLRLQLSQAQQHTEQREGGVSTSSAPSPFRPSTS